MTVPMIIPTEEVWRLSANCAQTDPELFYPEPGESLDPARKICASCPVAKECLNWALKHEEWYGVWGGLSEKQRRNLANGKGWQQCIRCGDDYLSSTTGHVQKYCSRSCSALAIQEKRRAAAS